MLNMNIPLEDIIDFKLEHEKQLCHFRRRIEEFQWNLTYCSNTEDLIECTKMFRNDIADELNEINELIKSKNKRNLKRTVRAMIPVAIITGVELLAFKGKVSQEGLIAANTILGVAILLFGSDESVEYNEKKFISFCCT